MTHVLVCPIGTSFNVVTEALWCLLKDEDPPDSVYVLTTQPDGHMGREPLCDAVNSSGEQDVGERVLAAALERARAERQDGTAGDGGSRIDAIRWLLREKIIILQREFGITEHVINFTLEVAQKDDGTPLTDALLPEDGVTFERRLLTRLMRVVSDSEEGYDSPVTTTSFERNPDVRLSMTMAGGRKYFATAARLHITTVGAPGDRLFDLVSQPAGVEFTGFWWPGHFHAGAETAIVNGIETRGEARLVEIPWIPGHVSAPGVAHADPMLAQSYAEALTVDFVEGKKPIIFDVLKGTISCRDHVMEVGTTKVARGKTKVRFTWSQFWLLAQLAVLKLERRGDYDAGKGSGWVTMSTTYNMDTDCEGSQKLHKEKTALKNLRDTCPILNKFGSIDRAERMKRARRDMNAAIYLGEINKDEVLVLQDYLPTVDRSIKSQLFAIFLTNPYLQARLKFDEETFTVKEGSTEHTSKVIRLAADPSEFIFKADGKRLDV